MPDLLHSYFDRELSTEEENSLAELLQGSAAEAQRFAELARAEYEATGFPEPSPPGTRRPWTAWPWALGLGVVGVAGWLSQAGPEPAPPRPAPPEAAAPAMERDVVRPAAKRPDPALPPKALQQPPAPEPAPVLALRVALDPGVPGRFRIVAESDSDGGALLSVRPYGGGQAQTLYQGRLPRGRWGFRWQAPPQTGRYIVELELEGHRARQVVEVGLRQP